MADEPSSVDAENVAVAVNYQCTECETLAAAYQFVFGTGEDVRFTPEGKRRLNQLKQEFKALKHRDDLSLAQLAAAIAVIAGEVVEVVDEELVVKEKGRSDPTTTTTSSSSTTSTTTTTDDVGSEATTTTVEESTTTTAP